MTSINMELIYNGVICVRAEQGHIESENPDQEIVIRDCL